MGLALAGLLVVIVAVAVILPFVRGRRGSPEPLARGTPDEQEVDARRGAAYEAISSLRMEYEIGAINAHEYEDRLLEYRRVAAEALREQERSGSDAAELEAAIRDARERLRADDAHCAS